MVGSRTIAISTSPVNPDHGTHVIDHDVSSISGGRDTKPGLDGENDRHQVCFAKTIQTVVGSDPDISFAVLKNGADKIVA